MHKLLETNKKIYYPSLAWLCFFLFSSLFLRHFVSFRFKGIYIMCYVLGGLDSSGRWTACSFARIFHAT